MKTVPHDLGFASYLDDFDNRQKERLVTVYQAIKTVLPNCEERMSYGIPTFKLKQNIIHFAGYKNHIAIYPGAKAVDHFSNQLLNYKTAKGTIQFSNAQDIPIALIQEIARFCLAKTK